MVHPSLCSLFSDDALALEDTQHVRQLNEGVCRTHNAFVVQVGAGRVLFHGLWSLSPP